MVEHLWIMVEHSPTSCSEAISYLAERLIWEGSWGIRLFETVDCWSSTASVISSGGADSSLTMVNPVEDSSRWAKETSTGKLLRYLPWEGDSGLEMFSTDEDKEPASEAGLLNAALGKVGIEEEAPPFIDASIIALRHSVQESKLKGVMWTASWIKKARILQTRKKASESCLETSGVSVKDSESKNSTGLELNWGVGFLTFQLRTGSRASSFREEDYLINLLAILPLLACCCCCVKDRAVCFWNKRLNSKLGILK